MRLLQGPGPFAPGIREKRSHLRVEEEGGEFAEFKVRQKPSLEGEEGGEPNIIYSYPPKA